jgi:hypothetical protein
MLLADEFIQGLWPHPLGQRLQEPRLSQRFGFEEIHAFMLS